MNVTNKLKANSTITVILITILIMTILGLVIYIAIDKDFVNISFNINDKKENSAELNKQNTNNFDVRDKANVAQNNEEKNKETIKKDVISYEYGDGDFVYLNDGEIYIGSYPDNSGKKITNTDGKITNFFISPKNDKLVYTIGEKIVMNNEYSQYFNQLTQQGGGTLSSDWIYNTKLFELDLQTGDVIELLSRLKTEQYMADLLLKSVEDRTMGTYVSINLLGYDNTGKYIIYSRDDSIAYDPNTSNFTKSEGATYIYDVNTKNKNMISDVDF